MDLNESLKTLMSAGKRAGGVKIGTVEQLTVQKDRPAYIGLDVPDGMSHFDITKTVLARMPTPQRRIGVLKMLSPVSLVDFVNRFVEKDRTVLFADSAKRNVVAIMNYHEPTTLDEEGPTITISRVQNEPENQDLPESASQPYAVPVGPSLPEADTTDHDVTSDNERSTAGDEDTSSLPPVEVLKMAIDLASSLRAERGPKPQWADFRANYSFPLSRQWNAWKKVDNTMISQFDLAHFLEDNIRDIADPAVTSLTPSLQLLIDRLNLHVGSPSRLLEVARGMEVKSTEKVRNAINTSTGESLISYEEEHAGGGNPTLSEIRVPTAFLLTIPVFQNDAPYLLLCRLRYRKVEQTVKWIVSIQGADAALEDAFARGCTAIQDGTGVPLFYGEEPPTGAL